MNVIWLRMDITFAGLDDNTVILSSARCESRLSTAVASLHD